MAVQYLFDLGGIDVFAGADDHVVLAAADGDEPVFVPGAQVAGVHPALVELLLLLCRVVVIAVSGLFRAEDDDLAGLLAVMGHHLVGLGLVVVIGLDHPHLIVDAAASGGAGVLGQVIGAQERVPQRLGGAVAVVDVGGEYLHIALTGGLFKGRAHGDQTLEPAQIHRVFLLRAAQHLHGGWGAHGEGHAVLVDGLETQLGLEYPGDDGGCAHIEGGAGAAHMDAAPVEPGGHVEQHVVGVHGVVHDNVVGAQHLVDVVYRYALGQGGGAGGAQAQHLVIDVGAHLHLRVGDELIADIVLIGNMALGQGGALQIVRHDYAGGLEFGQLHGLGGHGGDVGGIDEHLRAVVVDEQGGLTGGQVEVAGVHDGAQLAGGDIAEGELRAIEQGGHYHIILAHAVGVQRVSQPIGLVIELVVVPAPAGGRVDHGRFLCVAADVAVKTVQPGVLVLKSVPEHGVVISACHSGSSLRILCALGGGGAAESLLGHQGRV